MYVCMLFSASIFWKEEKSSKWEKFPSEKCIFKDKSMYRIIIFGTQAYALPAGHDNIFQTRLKAFLEATEFSEYAKISLLLMDEILGH